MNQKPLWQASRNLNPPSGLFKVSVKKQPPLLTYPYSLEEQLALRLGENNIDLEFVKSMLKNKSFNLECFSRAPHSLSLLALFSVQNPEIYKLLKEHPHFPKIEPRMIAWLSLEISKNQDLMLLVLGNPEIEVNTKRALLTQFLLTPSFQNSQNSAFVTALLEEMIKQNTTLEFGVHGLFKHAFQHQEIFELLSEFIHLHEDDISRDMFKELRYEAKKSHITSEWLAT